MKLIPAAETTHLARIAATVLIFLSVNSAAIGQNPLSVSRPETDNSVAAELKSFTLAEGYQANLFADETDGVANPVCMSWDPSGRLWVNPSGRI